MKYQKQNYQATGFTLIELLVVISIIGLLSSLAVVSLNSARIKARDAKRLADVRQVQTAIELFFNERGFYPGLASDPKVGVTANLGLGSYACLNRDGWGETGCTQPFMARVPVDPGIAGADYIFNRDETDLNAYSITFILESSTPFLNSGLVSATHQGLRQAQ